MTQQDTTRRSRYFLALFEGRVDGKHYTAKELASMLNLSPHSIDNYLLSMLSYRREVEQTIETLKNPRS